MLVGRYRSISMFKLKDTKCRPLDAYEPRNTIYKHLSKVMFLVKTS